MSNKKFGYARVSTAEQNEDRQVLELLKYGIELMVLSTECNFLPNGVFDKRESAHRKDAYSLLL